MYRVTKRLSDASIAHRLGNNYPSKCKNLHGHNYSFEVTLKSNILDEFGMVLDFNEIKTLFDSWIQDNWDHAVLVQNSDNTLLNFLKSEDQRYYHFVIECNTTAEMMSKYLFNKFDQLLSSSRIKLDSVKVWETKDSYAEYRGKDE